MEAREDQIRESRAVKRLYSQCCENCLNRIKHFVQETPCVGDAQAEKLGPSSADNDENNDGPISSLKL